MSPGMRRLQLFEFNEISWLPAQLRVLITDYLVCLTRLTPAFFQRLPLLAKAMRHASRQDQVVDLCSGSGGAWHQLADRLDRMFPHAVEIVLTDLYPDCHHQHLLNAHPKLRFHPEAIDATQPSHRLDGLQTLFNAFHQFPPEQARQVLGRAVENQQPIAVMELLQRRWTMLPLVLLTPLMVLILTPFIRPLSSWRLAMTYLLPLAPLLITWDTLVSWLRCYTPEELMTMARSLDAPHYHWEAGSYWYRWTPVTYLVGYPVPDQPGHEAGLKTETTVAISAIEPADADAGPVAPRPGR